MKKFLFTAYLTLMSLAASAQVNPERGFIITNENDTIYGTLDFRTNKVNSEHCLFKADNDTVSKMYYPGNILGYRFMRNGKFYVTKTFAFKGDSVTYFAEYLVKGMMNLYRIPAGVNNSYVFFLEDENGDIIPYEKDGDYTVSSGLERKRIIEKTKPLYDKVALVGDVKKDIKIGRMKEREMIKLVRDYHDYRCTSREECIEFEYDEKSDRAENHLNVHSGTVFIPNVNSHPHYGFKYSIGIGDDIKLKRVAKNLYAQVAMDFFFTSHRYDKVEKLSENVLSISGGMYYGIGKENKTKFTVRGGYMFCMNYWKSEYKDYHSSDIDLAPLGAYTGIGLEIPLSRKISLLVNADCRFINNLFAEDVFLAFPVLTVGCRF